MTAYTHLYTNTHSSAPLPLAQTKRLSSRHAAVVGSSLLQVNVDCSEDTPVTLVCFRRNKRPAALPRTRLNPHVTKSCDILCLPHLGIFFGGGTWQGRKDPEFLTTPLTLEKEKVLFIFNNPLFAQLKCCTSVVVLVVMLLQQTHTHTPNTG